jgi:opacity protein-like surface antigen
MVVLVAAASPARADLTAFIGAQSNPSTRMTRGVSGGAGFLVVAFEGEYAQAAGDDTCPSPSHTAGCTPSVRTVMFNGLVQTPKGILPKAQLYATVGGGYYRVRFESQDVQDTGFGTNIGGGVKIDLAGPLRLRLDYRLFKLTKDTESGGSMPTAQRFYAGVNLAF